MYDTSLTQPAHMHMEAYTHTHTHRHTDIHMYT